MVELWIFNVGGEQESRFSGDDVFRGLRHEFWQYFMDEAKVRDYLGKIR